jgi:hypothetical protein
VVQARVFGQFSGQIGAERDTTKRRGDTKDRRGRQDGETKNGRDRRRHEDTHDDRALLDGWERTSLSDRSSVLGQKETDPRGLRGSAGSRKVPDTKIKKATTVVVAQDNLSASSSRTSSPSSLLALGNHLLLATHCTVI